MFTATEEKIYAEPWKEVGLALFLLRTTHSPARKHERSQERLVLSKPLWIKESKTLQQKWHCGHFAVIIVLDIIPLQLYHFYGMPPSLGH